MYLNALPLITLWHILPFIPEYLRWLSILAPFRESPDIIPRNIF